MTIEFLTPQRTFSNDRAWFWAAIDVSVSNGAAEQLAKLTRILRGMPDQDLVDFIHLFRSEHNALYSWKLWAAAYVINGGCSDDGFIDFRNWLMARGRRTTEAAAADPDSLADFKIEADTAFFEEFGYVMLEAYQSRAGGKFPQLDGENRRADPSDEDWKFDFDDSADMRRRLPRLAAEYLK